MAASDSEHQRSIAQINRMIRSVIEAETLEQFFWVGGRIDRLYRSDFGHVYFDLVDDRSRIRCFVREERASGFPFDLRDHLEVQVYGDIHFYEERAETQINVIDLRILDQSADTTPVVERLRALGLYPVKKRAPPANIHRIAIITSQSSRAIGDFESAYQSAGERAVLAPVNWTYVALEGDRAIPSIIDAILELDRRPDIDLIALIRGGGRAENLAAFNAFEIAGAICRCNTYIITGIGHHKDKTLADDLADYSASTPTAAAYYLADLCLRAMPSKRVNHSHQLESDVASSPSRHRANFRASETQADARNLLDQQQPAPSPSQSINALIVVLLALAVAAIAFLIAVLLSQTP